METIEGKGKKKKKEPRNNIQFIVGGGVVKKDEEKYIELGKYMLNIKELKETGILTVKYVKNKQIVSKLPRQKVTSNVREMLIALCENGEFSKETFDALNLEEQKLFIKFVQLCNLDIGYDVVFAEIDEFEKDYQLLLSEWQSGKASVDIERKLRKLIIQGIQKKKLPLQSSLILLAKLE